MHNLDINIEGWDDIPLPIKFGIGYIGIRARQNISTALNLSGLLLTETGIIL